MVDWIWFNTVGSEHWFFLIICHDSWGTHLLNVLYYLIYIVHELYPLVMGKQNIGVQRTPMTGDSTVDYHILNKDFV